MILIIDTDQCSNLFADKMSKFITGRQRCAEIDTPSFGNNGYGFTAQKNDEGYLQAKEHYIDYKIENDLKKNILEPLKFYKDTRATKDIERLLVDKERVEKEIELLKARDKSTFLPYPTKQSVLIEFQDESLLEEYKQKAIQFCNENNIGFFGFRYEEEKSEPKFIVTNKTDLKVLVKEYKGRLYIESLNTDEDDIDFLPSGGNTLGCVLRNTKRLGISPEAYDVLKQVSRGRDALGDLCGESNEFSWIGNVNTILGPSLIGSKYYQLVKDFISISNDSIPEIVKNFIDASEKEIEIPYEEIRFELWIELTENRKYNHETKQYETDNSYRLNSIVQNAYIHEENVKVISAPKGCLETKYENSLMIISDQKSEVKEQIEKIFDKDVIRDFDITKHYGYDKSISSDIVLDYVNSFFDLGFSNNIMWPKSDYYRLSYKGTINELKEKLSNFKLTK